MGFYEALSGADETLEVIKRSIELGKSQGVNFRPVIRASRNVASGIVNSAEEEKCDLIIMGFPKENIDYKETVFTQTLKLTHTDLLILNLKIDPEQFNPEKIGVYVRETKNLHLMLMAASAVAERRKARIVLLGFLPEGYSNQQKKQADNLLVESLQNLKSTALYDVKLNISNNPVEDLIKMSSNYDVLVVGKDRKLKEKQVEELPSFQISRRAECTVLIVKTVRTFDKIVSSF